jgi:cytidine deaminase
MEKEKVFALLEEAKHARKFSKSEFSGFAVGAAVQTSSGKIFHGTNIESSSYGLTICAERVAIFKAISEGEEDIEYISVIADTEEPVSPCGACRQIMVDYAANAKVVLGNLEDTYKITTTKKLLPHSFSKKDLL